MRRVIGTVERSGCGEKVGAGRCAGLSMRAGARHRGLRQQVVVGSLLLLLGLTPPLRAQTWQAYAERYAIIVMGGNVSPGTQLYGWYWGDTYGMYTALIGRGFAPANVRFLSYGPSADAHPEAVDGLSTVANIRAAYQWARDVCTAGDLLYVYWVDHGSPTGFEAYDGSITHVEIGQLTAAIGCKRVVGAYNPCYSGGVVDDVSRSGVITTTSQNASQGNSWGWAGQWRVALAGGTPGDPSDGNADGHVSITEAYQWICPKSQAAGEHPWYDDNGDHVPHECTDSGFDPGDPSADGFDGRFFSLDGWSFATSIRPPVLATLDPSDVTRRSATLLGSLVDLGGAVSCEVWFEWGETAAYGSATAPQVRSVTGVFQDSLSGLSPGTAYHYRACGSSEGGTSCGADEAFATSVEAPDLACSEVLNLGSVLAGRAVDASFTVANRGDPGTRLSWGVVEHPAWSSEWTFEPSQGTDLAPEDGPVTVHVSLAAPMRQAHAYRGEIRVANAGDAQDACRVDVTLRTPLFRIVSPSAGTAGVGASAARYPRGAERLPLAFAWVVGEDLEAAGVDEGTSATTAYFCAAGSCCAAGPPDSNGVFACRVHMPESYNGLLTAYAYSSAGEYLDADEVPILFERPGEPLPDAAGWLGTTQIALANGSSKSIAEVIVGDQVAAYDLRHAAATVAGVTRTIHHAAGEGPGRYLTINGSLQVAPTQLLLANGRLTFAEAVRWGDRLLRLDGTPVPVDTIATVDTPVETYDLLISSRGEICDPYLAYVAAGVVAHSPSATLGAWLADEIRAETEDLDLGAGEASAINEDGEVVGFERDPAGGSAGVVWHPHDPGVPIPREVIPGLGGSNSAGEAVNDAGQATGFADTAGGMRHAYLYLPEGAYGTARGTHDIGTLGGPSSDGHALNGRGQVAGESERGDGLRHAFLWLPLPDSCRDAGGATRPLAAGMLDLGALGGQQSLAAGVNDAIQVVGRANTPGDSSWHAFRWDCGTMRDLGTLPGGSRSEAHDVDGAGRVVGRSATSGDGVWHAFLWIEEPTCAFVAGMNDLGTLGGAESAALAISERGEIVGWAEDGSGARHAFLHQRCRMVDLNDLVVEGQGWTLVEARDVNDAGQIVGIAERAGETRAFVLSPIRFADLDHDQGVTSGDLVRFEACFTGPGGVVAAGCEAADFDDDLDVDCPDWFRFVQAWTAPEAPPASTFCPERITLSVRRSELSWTPVDGAIGCDLVRGDLRELLASRGSFVLSTRECLAVATPGTTLPYASDPPSGQGHWFLVRGKAAGGVRMTYDSSMGREVRPRDRDILDSERDCP